MIMQYYEFIQDINMIIDSNFGTFSRQIGGFNIWKDM